MSSLGFIVSLSEKYEEDAKKIYVKYSKLPWSQYF